MSPIPAMTVDSRVAGTLPYSFAMTMKSQAVEAMP